MDERPIGVFDSGLGGLTVLKELKKCLPKEDLIYLGDTARVPYGNRSKETVINFSRQDAIFLIKKNIKCLVIACNTASAFAAGVLRSELGIPVFDVISSGSKMAAQFTSNKKIGVIATRGTVKSDAYPKTISKTGDGLEVIQNAAPLLALLVEEGEIEGKIIELAIKKYLSAFNESGIDTLVLGCTHYPLIAQSIRQLIGERVKLINPAEGLAKEVSTYLKENNMKNEQEMGTALYFVTDLNENFIRVGEMFLQEKIRDSLSKVEL